MSDIIRTIDEWGEIHNLRILQTKEEESNPIEKALWSKKVDFQTFSKLTDKYGFEARTNPETDTLKAIVVALKENPDLVKKILQQ